MEEGVRFETGAEVGLVKYSFKLLRFVSCLSRKQRFLTPLSDMPLYKSAVFIYTRLAPGL